MRPLDIYDDMPSAMRAYISHNGFHFNKAACEYAVRQMRKKTAVSAKPEPLDAWTKDEVDALLTKYNITLENKVLYDYVFVANMAKADYYKSSIADDQHLALFVKDYIDDVDASDETAFRRWIATCVGNGDPVDWDAIL